jgi:hypothetical protein
MDQKGAALPHCDGRIEENMAAAVADSDDRFRRPGGAIGSGARGEKERRPGAFIGADTGKKRARIKEELKGELTEGVTRSPANNSVQRREMTGSDRWGLLVSEKKD